MTTFSSVVLHTGCRWRTGTDGGGQAIYKEYEEGELHQPLWKNNSVILPTLNPSGAKSYSNVTPRKGRELSEMELPLELSDYGGRLFAAADGYRFIAITTSGSKYILGWIDEIVPIATKGPSANALIRWHIDAWMTWVMNHRYNPAFGGSFGCGRIKRGPAALARPDSSVPRKWTYDTALTINPSGYHQGDGSVSALSNRQWIIIMVSSNIDKMTDFSYYVWQDSMMLNGMLTPYMEEIYDGKVADLLGIDPDKIVGAWISPIPPFPMNETSASAHIESHGTGADQRACFKFDTLINTASEYTETYGTKKCTTDAEKWVLVDIYGTPRLTTPWGIEWDTVKLILDIGTAGANLIVYLQDSADTSDINEGRITTVPLPTIPILSNAWSSYVYSGQRDYDIQNRELQNQQQALNGIAGSGQAAISGGIAGGVSKAGGGVGAVAGLAANVIGTLVGYGINTVYGDKEQNATDKLAANQAAAPIITGQSLVWKYFDGFLDEPNPLGSHNWRFVKMVRDTVSAAELSAEQTELGYNTDSVQADCSTIIESGGPLRIEGLEMHGNYLPELKSRISEMFARGVHLDLIQ